MAYNKKQKKNRYIVILLILVMVISIGYAYLSSNLNINGIANIGVANWSVYFSNVQVTDGSVEAIEAPEVPEGSKTTKSLSYEVEFNSPGEFYEFTADIVNDGSIDAMLDSIMVSNLSPAQEKYLDYTVIYADGKEIAKDGAKDLLRVDETETIKVGLYYKEDVVAADLPTEDEIVSATITLNYVQADDTAVERREMKKNGRLLTMEDVGKYVDIGVDVVKTSSTEDDWKVLDVGNNVILILGDYLPVSKMNLPPNVANDGNIHIWASSEKTDVINFLLDESKWSDLVQGATVPIRNVRGGVSYETYSGLLYYYESYYGQNSESTEDFQAKFDSKVASLVPEVTPDGTSGFWLASSGGHSADSICCVIHNGQFGEAWKTNNHYGVCPIVIVPGNTLFKVVGEEY